MNPLPIPVITSSGPIVFCSGDSVILSVSKAKTYLWNNQFKSPDIIIYAEGDYEVTVTDSNGCTAVSDLVSIKVNILNKPVISRNGHLLTSSALSGNQWYFNGNEIDGATGATYQATENGNYTVEVKDSFCMKTSDPAVISDISIRESRLSRYVKIVPNPSEGRFRILTNITGPVKIEVNNSVGEIVYTSDSTDAEIDLRTLAKGVYHIVIQAGGKSFHQKLIIN